MTEYNYYWYHHMLPDEERKEIQNAIESKDYDKFLELYKEYQIKAIEDGFYSEEYKTWYPMTYLPDTVYVYKDDSEEPELEYIACKSTFKAITHSECECG